MIETMLPHLYNLKLIQVSYYRYKPEYQMVSGHVMSIYLMWYMSLCHEPLVAQISICSNTSGRVEYFEAKNMNTVEPA